MSGPTPRPVVCGHPDAKHQALGMCRYCYDKQYTNRNRERINARLRAAYDPAKRREAYARETDALERRRQYWAANPGRFSGPSRRNHLRRKYGMTPDDYERMYQSQSGLCAICEDWHERLAIDHDHETGKVRALLCDKCNKGLGSFRDNPDHLSVAAQYVYMHKPLVAVA